MRSTTFETHFAAAAMADEASRPMSAGHASAGRTATQLASPAKSALWTKLYTSLIEARQAQAKAIVARHMAQQDDATLRSLSWSDAEIADLRRKFGPSGH
jgi:hypothetical protein